MQFIFQLKKMHEKIQRIPHWCMFSHEFFRHKVIRRNWNGRWDWNKKRQSIVFREFRVLPSASSIRFPQYEPRKCQNYLAIEQTPVGRHCWRLQQDSTSKASQIFTVFTKLQQTSLVILVFLRQVPPVYAMANIRRGPGSAFRYFNMHGLRSESLRQASSYSAAFHPGISWLLRDLPNSTKFHRAPLVFTGIFRDNATSFKLPNSVGLQSQGFIKGWPSSLRWLLLCSAKHFAGLSEHIKLRHSSRSF